MLLPDIYNCFVVSEAASLLTHCELHHSGISVFEQIFWNTFHSPPLPPVHSIGILNTSYTFATKDVSNFSGLVCTSSSCRAEWRKDFALMFAQSSIIVRLSSCEVIHVQLLSRTPTGFDYMERSISVEPINYEI